ncbi:formyltransferase family protein [Candidatus Nitrosopelagicus sp.]|nr:formyltransferase family protein [Candidatus Nitrosopelagicus sp.]|tara:strand:+ start:7203 stop:8117 length:915 start_codon:yes stop_codon:yes gene_type:complete
MNKKIVVCGCTEFGYDVTNHLISQGIQISHIISLNSEQAEKSKVSGYKSFETLSIKYNIPIFYPKLYSLKDESDLSFFQNEKFDLLLVCGWQRLIPENVLETLRIGGIGSHGSSELLPKGRGRSPVNWSIIEGKKHFILQLFLLTPGVDDGDILYHQTFDINEWDTCQTIYYKISLVMKQSLSNLIPKIFLNDFSRIPQKGEPSFYPKRTPEDGKISWNKTTFEIHNLIKAVTKPYPGAFSFIHKQKIMFWKAQPFDTKIDFLDAKIGQVVEKFSTGDFVVKCKVGLILITDYDGEVNTGDILI